MMLYMPSTLSMQPLLRQGTDGMLRVGAGHVMRMRVSEERVQTVVICVGEVCSFCLHVLHGGGMTSNKLALYKTTIRSISVPTLNAFPRSV